MRLATGWLPWTLAPLLGALVLAYFWWPGALAGVGLALFVLLFFRDPDRETGEGIVAPADGHIRSIDGVAVTFLNLHHVHVVRAPFAGRVQRVERVTGSHLPAFLKGAAKNGGVSITIDTRWGTQRVDLKAGFIARRAVSYVEEGDELDKGQRIGMILFGSRVDTELPDPVARHVEAGDRVWAAATTLATPTEALEASP